ncbi:hypothetical protein BCR44DRAFT_371577 [Catenaria anguillulae PL171]|uniref:Uncharacterized protein n=1 Tax=Catenaria anguillulae PL171 TaxID=765915 RepID=A0A1Y2I316_9FUNG|nr:hypothetical protein BCR44DRAFT_371577 [Catenaria anguillulae PL171]
MGFDPSIRVRLLLSTHVPLGIRFLFFSVPSSLCVFLFVPFQSPTVCVYFPLQSRPYYSLLLLILRYWTSCFVVISLDCCYFAP